MIGGKREKWIFVLLLGLGLLSVAADSQYKSVEITGDWAHKPVGLTDKDIAWKNFTGFFENEHVFMLARLDEGYWFVGMIFTFKYGPQRRWGLYALAADDSGRRWFAKREIKPEEVKLSYEKLSWRSGNTWVEGSYPVYTMHIEEPNLGAHLEFKSRVKGWQSGRWFLTPDHKTFGECFIIAPWADVSGKLVLDGKTIPVHGLGYSDRYHGNLRFDQTDPLFYSVRAIKPMPGSEDVNIQASYDHLSPSFGKLTVPGLFIIQPDRLEVGTMKVIIRGENASIDPKVGYAFPRKLVVDAAEGDFSLHGVFVADRSIEVLDIFKQLPAYIRAIAELFWKRPVYSKWEGRFRGSYKIGSQEKRFDLLAIAEINYTGSINLKDGEDF